MRSDVARVIILSGTRSVGKSTACLRAVELAQARGYACRGVVTVREPDDGRAVLDVQSGATRRLTLGQSARCAVVQGRFRFDAEVLAWGNEVLAHAVPCHLLVVDELGPLEIERNQGWVRAFEVLEAGGYTMALVVVRPELLATAERRLPRNSTTVLAAAIDNRDALPEILVTMLEARAIEDGDPAGEPVPDWRNGTTC